MVNNATLLGRIGTVKPSEKCFKFSIATTESWRNKETNEYENKTEWHNCVVFGKFAQSLAKRMTVGAQAYVSGKITTNCVETDGEKKYYSSIIADKVQLIGGKKAEAAPESEEVTPEPTKKSAPVTKKAIPVKKASKRK